MEMVYKVYNSEDELVMETEHPAFAKRDIRTDDFYDVPEKDAEVIVVRPEEGDAYYANIAGKEVYSWLPTVRIEKE